MNIYNLSVKNNYQNPEISQKNNFKSVDFSGKRLSGISFSRAEKSEDKFVSSDENQILKKACPLEEVKNLLLEIVELKHPPTKQHLVGTSVYAKTLAQRLNLPKEKVDEIEIAALFHDVGKVGLPDSYFVGKRNEEAYEKHPIDGSKLVQKIKAFRGTISDIIMNHHSHWNGTGFPNKLKGEEISIETRIVSIADTFDTMTKQKYPKQKVLSAQEAFKILKENKHGKWAPGFVQAFVDMVSENNYALYKQVVNSKY